MNRLIAEFNELYPDYSIGDCCPDYSFLEKENKNKVETFQELRIKALNGYPSSSQIVKDASSIFQKAKSPCKILIEDCDGFFFREHEGRKYLYICELKSTFSTQQIGKAKDQIVGSYVKLHGLMSLLQAYHPEEWTVQGIIASFSPDPETLSYLSRQKEDGNPLCSFCFDLNRDKKYIMPEMNNIRYFSPLAIPELTIHYVAVPNRQNRFEIDLAELL